MNQRTPPPNLKLTLRIRRTRGWQDYSLEAKPDDTVMDLLERLRREKARDLLYRHSCHHGSCGTCGCLINGKEALACLSILKDLPSTGDFDPREGGILVLEPLKHHPLIGDLAVDPAALFRELPEGADYRRAGETEKGPLKGTPVYLRFEDCIECGCCVSACPVGDQFRGPAGLAAVNRERRNHPEKEESLLREAAEMRGVPGCDKVFACSRVCPSHVAPGRQIQELRKDINP